MNESGYCSMHSGRLDPVELGRRSAKSRKAKRERRGSFRGALRELLERDPERYASRLLESGAKGLELADRFLAEEDAREAEGRQTGPLHDSHGRPVVGLADVLSLVYSLPGAAVAFGLPELGAAQLEALEAARARWHERQGFPPQSRRGESRALPEERVTPVPSGTDPDTYPLPPPPESLGSLSISLGDIPEEVRRTSCRLV